MIEHPERIEQFKTDIAQMQVRDPASGRDKLMTRGGFTLMVIGIVMTIVGYAMSYNSDGPLGQNDAQIVAIIGLALAVVGAALFVRGSIATFLRFWLARLIYEQKAQTDRLLDR